MSHGIVGFCCQEVGHKDPTKKLPTDTTSSNLKVEKHWSTPSSFSLHSVARQFLEFDTSWAVPGRCFLLFFFLMNLKLNFTFSFCLSNEKPDPYAGCKWKSALLIRKAPHFREELFWVCSCGRSQGTQKAVAEQESASEKKCLTLVQAKNVFVLLSAWLRPREWGRREC